MSWGCCWTDRFDWARRKGIGKAVLHFAGSWSSGKRNSAVAGMICLTPGSAAWIHRLLVVCRFRFYRLGCREFPVSMWLGARSTRMQFTDFPNRCTTSNTRHGQYLFRREFPSLHPNIMQLSEPQKCPVLLISMHQIQVAVILCARPVVCPSCEQKGTSFAMTILTKFWRV